MMDNNNSSEAFNTGKRTRTSIACTRCHHKKVAYTLSLSLYIFSLPVTHTLFSLRSAVMDVVLAAVDV